VTIKKGACVFIHVAISGDRNGFKKEAYNIIKIYRPYIINSAQVECESKSDPSNTRGNRNHFKVTQTIPEQHTGKSRNQGTIKTSHIGHCTHTSESTNVKVQNIFHWWNNITWSTNCKHRTAATLYTLQTWFVQVYKCKHPASRW